MLIQREGGRERDREILIWIISSSGYGRSVMNNIITNMNFTKFIVGLKIYIT
jgi:hypothetical protein